MSVNGVSTGIAWKPPYRVDVTGLLKAGMNRIEVKVTNVWHNRIVGDLKYPEGRRVRAHQHEVEIQCADMELLPSGLIGPVVLRQKVQARIGRCLKKQVHPAIPRIRGS